MSVTIVKAVRTVLASQFGESGRKQLFIAMEGGFQFNVNEGDETAGFSKLCKYAKPGVVLKVECSGLKHGSYDTGRSQTLPTGAQASIVYDQFTLIDPELISIAKGKESSAAVDDGLEEVERDFAIRERKPKAETVPEYKESASDTPTDEKF